MNGYSVEIAEEAAKKIRKLDRETQRLILSYINRNLKKLSGSASFREGPERSAAGSLALPDR